MCEAAIGGCLPLIVNDTYSGIKRHCNYLCRFRSNLDNLAARAETLEAQKEDLLKIVEVAKRDGLEIKAEVKKWLEETTNILAEKTDIEEGIPRVQSCSNIKLRYSLSKRAEEAVEVMRQLPNPNTFGEDVALPRRPGAEMVPFSWESNTLQSRKEKEATIVAALRLSGVNIVGIWGVGGAGKTFTAKSVLKRMKTDKLVDETVEVAVSQKVNVLEIQQKIAKSVGVTLDSKEELATSAQKLRLRLIDARRKIILVDDIWEKLNFEEIGIPCGSDSGGCKILVTSRNNKLLQKMDKVFAMDTLREEDAWSLFREKAGTCVDYPNLKPTTEQVLAECKGLPLAIVVVGGALQDQTLKGIWEDALHQLKNANPKEIDGVEKEVYNVLRLSYDYLETDSAQSLFLLCSIFPEDFEICLEDLALYGMGLNMFEGVHTLSQARNRVLTLVDKLKSCALLLDGYDEKHVTMHDVVRDVARFIAREETLIVERLRLKGQSHGNCKWAFIRESAKDSNYKIGADFRCLHLLIIQYHGWNSYMNIDGFPSVGGMQELEVLSLQKISWELVDCRLKNLKTLELVDCPMKNLSFVGELMGLEILKCRSCGEIEELPIEIGNLGGTLKLLDLFDCRNLKRIRAGAIFKLNELEELVISDCKKMEEVFLIENNEQVEKNNLTFSKLVRMKIKGMSNLKVFGKGIESIQFPFLIKLYLDASSKFKWIDSQDGCNHDENSLHYFCNEKVTFGILQNLKIKEYDARSLWCQQIPLQFFEALEKLHMVDCHNRSFCSFSIATNFINLEKLIIEWCDDMECVIEVEKPTHHNSIRSGKIQPFPQLESLVLGPLEKLKTLSEGIETFELHMLDSLTIYICPKFIGSNQNQTYGCNMDNNSLHLFCSNQLSPYSSSSLTFLRIGEYDDVSNLWCQQIPPCFFQSLEWLEIWYCSKLKSAFPYLVAKHLLNLQNLEIYHCNQMEFVVSGLENETREQHSRLFPSLVNVTLWGLPLLEMFCERECSLTLPSLKSMTLPSVGWLHWDKRMVHRKSTNEEVVDWNNLLCQHIREQKEEEERRRRRRRRRAETSYQQEEERRRRRAETSYQHEEEEAETSDQSSTPTSEPPTNEELHKDELHVDAVPSLSRQEFGSFTTC